MDEQEILYIGAVMVDVMCQAPSLPQRGGCLVLWDREISLGGCAFNSANITRQLGGRAQLFAPVGTGPYASYVQAELERRGMSGLPVDMSLGSGALDCGACICLVEPDGERTMITLPGVERHFQDEWLRRLDPARYSHGVFNGFEVEGEAGEAIVSFFERNPSIVPVYAPGPRVMDVPDDLTQRILALHPLIHLNEEEALRLSGADGLEEAGEALRKMSGNAVVITQGAAGSWAFTDEGSRGGPGEGAIFAPAESITPIDTIGAGDAHIGALMAALQAGLGWPEALDRANKVSAAVCGSQGAVLEDDDPVWKGLRLP